MSIDKERMLPEELPHKEKMLEIINSLPIAEDFELPSGFPIPIGQNIIIKPIITKEHKLDSGIILPEGSSKKRNYTGVVYSLGEEVNIPVRPGLTVDYEDHAYNPSSELNFKSQQYLVVGQYTIRAIVTPGSFKFPKWETNEEKRRQNRMDEQASVNKNIQRKVDNLDEKAPR